MTLTKKVSGSRGDTSKAFTFTFTLTSGLPSTAPADAYPYTIVRQDGTEETGVQPTQAGGQGAGAAKLAQLLLLCGEGDPSVYGVQIDPPVQPVLLYRDLPNLAQWNLQRHLPPQ